MTPGRKFSIRMSTFADSFLMTWRPCSDLISTVMQRLFLPCTNAWQDLEGFDHPVFIRLSFSSLVVSLVLCMAEQCKQANAVLTRLWLTMQRRLTYERHHREVPVESHMRRDLSASPFPGGST